MAGRWRAGFAQSDSVRVELTAELRQRIENLLGEGNYRLLAAPAKTNTKPATRNFNRDGNRRPANAK